MKNKNNFYIIYLSIIKNNTKMKIKNMIYKTITLFGKNSESAKDFMICSVLVVWTFIVLCY